MWSEGVKVERERKAGWNGMSKMAERGVVVRGRVSVREGEAKRFEPRRLTDMTREGAHGIWS